MSDLFDEVEREFKRKSSFNPVAVIAGVFIAVVFCVVGYGIFQYARDPEAYMRRQGELERAYDDGYYARDEE